MKPILIELDDALAAELERVAPARSRQRSEFVRAALRRALWDVEERRTREAYLRVSDATEAAWFDPEAWQPAAPVRRRERPRRTPARAGKR